MYLKTYKPSDHLGELFSHFFQNDFDQTRVWQPRTDIIESEKSYDLVMELPGLEKKDVTIVCENRELQVSGERKKNEEVKEDGYNRLERFYGSFSRRFSLPEHCDFEKTTANFKNGLLSISIPKSEKVQPKKIEIKTS